MSETYVVLPASHRLFAVFDSPEQATEALQEVEASGLEGNQDAWVFSGQEGLEALDPRVGAHGVAVGIVRVIQRMLTSDCEYCDGLERAIASGGAVVAVKVPEESTEEMGDILQRHGAHSLAYGAHWNFVPLPHASQTPGAA